MGDIKIIDQIISKDRFLPYLNYNNNDTSKAIMHYKANILVSESFYPLLSVLEVGLRNSINYQLTRMFDDVKWYENRKFIKIVTGFQIDRITDAKNSLLRDKKEVTPGRIVAALSFGFWTSLFDSRFSSTLWKNLRLAFPYCPKKKRQRRTISANLNNIRRFRNRLFHHEAILWNIVVVNGYKEDMKETILWLEKGLELWIEELSRVDKVIDTTRKEIKL